MALCGRGGVVLLTCRVARSRVARAGFVQSAQHGNFEVVAPLTTGGLAHWWRDSGVPAQPWHGPTGFGHGTFSAAALIQNDNGNLEVVAVQGSDLVHFWRDAANAWHGPIAIAGGGVSGHPGFVQAKDGTFQVVAPLAVGGLGHWIRDAAKQWSGPTGVWQRDRARGRADPEQLRRGKSRPGRAVRRRP